MERESGGVERESGGGRGREEGERERRRDALKPGKERESLERQHDEALH